MSYCSIEKGSNGYSLNKKVRRGRQRLSVHLNLQELFVEVVNYFEGKNVKVVIEE